MTLMLADISTECLTPSIPNPSTPSAIMSLINDNDEPVDLRKSSICQSGHRHYLHPSSLDRNISPPSQYSESYGFDDRLPVQRVDHTYEWQSHLHPWPFPTLDTAIMPFTTTITSPPEPCSWNNPENFAPFTSAGTAEGTDMDGDSYMWQQGGFGGPQSHQSAPAISQSLLWISHMQQQGTTTTAQYRIMDSGCFTDLTSDISSLNDGTCNNSMSSSSVPYGIEFECCDTVVPTSHSEPGSCMTSNFETLTYAVLAGTEQNVLNETATTASMLPSEPGPSTTTTTDPFPRMSEQQAGIVVEVETPENKSRLRPRHPASCFICNTQFDRPSDLRQHMYEHDGQHECTVCGKRYHEKYQLSNHEKSHAGPHSCTQCDKIFEKRSSLRSHLTTHDGHPKLLACPVSGCGKQYRRGGCLNRHVKSVRSQPPQDWQRSNREEYMRANYNRCIITRIISMERIIGAVTVQSHFDGRIFETGMYYV